MTADPTAPDGRPPLDVERVRREALAGSRLWSRLDVVEQAGSTNADLRAAALAGAGGGAVLVAEEQVAGRGRLGRRWQAPARSSLAVSVLLRPPSEGRGPACAWGWLPLLGGLAVGEAVADLTHLVVGLKWPNDVLVPAGKVAGVLTERVDTPAGPAVVLGTGVNVSQTADELPTPAAASLRTAGAPDVDRTSLLVALLDRLAARYGQWLSDPATLRAAYRARSATVGRAVRVELPGGRRLDGRAAAVDDDGCLLVDGDDGRAVVAAGDVVHVR